MDAEEDRTRQLGFKPQKEIVYNKLLPYAEDLDEESTKQLAEIKGNLGRAVRLRELRPGALYWTSRLNSYINLYGHKFSKEDHVILIKLLFELIIMPDLELALLDKFARSLTWLLKKSKLLSRDDLVLPWKPLYQLLERILCSQYEILGLEWTPRTLEGSLKSVVKLSRPYFSVESTQEMLDEWRPLLCPFDEMMSKGISCLELFLPTLLPPEHHQFGFKLWLDEMIGIWDSQHNCFSWEETLVELFARVANDNIGYIDWGPFMAKIFTRFMRGFNLPVGSKKRIVGSASKGYDIQVASCWIVSMMGNTKLCQEHLTNFFNAVESYFHPSNIGKYTMKLQRLLSALPNAFTRRLRRERFKKPSWKHPIPDSHKLSEDDITSFVECLKAAVFLSMYSKMGSMDAAIALQQMAQVRPELVLPQLLEKTYTALDTLIEPHQLVATVSCMVSVSKSLLTSSKLYPEGPSHLLPILSAMLPGIDPNDFSKCMITFQTISTFVSLVPLVDCSEAPLVRNDLTEQERDLCSATAGFEDFILMFMDRCFSLIENSCMEQIRSQDSNPNRANNQEKLVDVGLTSTFNTVLSQCSPQLFKVALDKLFSFVANKVLETKIAGKMVAHMCRSATKTNAKMALRKFIPHCSGIVLNLTSSEDVQLEEDLDGQLLFNLQILSEIVRCPSQELLEYRSILEDVLRSTLHLTCKEGYQLGCVLLRHIMKACCTTYPLEHCSVPGKLDRPFTEYLPIRDWGTSGDIDNLDIKWHLPTEYSIAAIKDLMKLFYYPEITKIQNFIKGAEMSREHLLQSLTIIHEAITGAGSIIPRWNKPVVPNLVESVMEQKVSAQLQLGTAEFSKAFTGIREEVIHMNHNLLEHMLATGEDDTKALQLICKIHNTLLWYTGTFKNNFDSRWKNFKMIKKAMGDKLHGNKSLMRALLVDRVHLQHEQRLQQQLRQVVYTEMDQIVAHDLTNLSMSRYSMVRKAAQNVLFSSIDRLMYSRYDIIPIVLDQLKEDENISHHTFKGALHILHAQSMGTLACVHDWELLQKCWTALVQAGHSEKLSIMKVIDGIVMKIHRVYDTVAITHKVSQGCVDVAGQLLMSGCPSTDIAAPTAEEMEQAVVRLNALNEKNLSIYTNMCTTLVELVERGNLRWKFSQMATGMLKLLLRHDTPPPTPVVRLFVNFLVDETLHVRKMAIAAVGAILKVLKRPHKMIPLDPYKVSGSTPPATITPGVRPDNAWHHFNSSTLPKTQEEWDACVFVEKTHWSFYTWPKDMKVYAGESEQPKLDRTVDELSESERAVHDCFSSEEFVKKLIEFLSLEDRKGRDKFNTKRFILFKGLFRNFGDAFLPVFKPHLSRLAQSSQESDQRCLAEIMTGLVRGSKHWGFTKTSQLWEFLSPILKSALSQVTVETLFDWGTAVSTMSESRDPRKLHWLFETLMEFPTYVEGGSFLEASWLYILQGGFAQQEWRIPELLRGLLEYLEQNLAHSYKNVRDHIGSTLATIFLYDFALPNGKPSSPHAKNFVDRVIPLLAPIQNLDSSPSTEGLNHGTAALNDKVSAEKEAAIRLCKTVMKWLVSTLGGMFPSTPSVIFQFLPLLAPLEGFESDEELSLLAKVLMAYMAQALLQPETIPIVLGSLQQIALGTSWRAKVTLLGYLQVMVYYNLFTVSNQSQSVATIHQLVLDLLKDDRLEVREMAGTTLSGLFHCGVFSIEPKLQNHFESLCKTRLPAKRVRLQSNFNNEEFSASVVQRHAGIIGLSACVQAYPYDVPEWMPAILMDLTGHLHDPQPIEMTVRKTLSDFRRTHHDNWHEHKQQFTDDQLVVLTNLLVSPCYYA
ncbi:proteasome activator complex subunit 4-like [Asterias amurensis]|uniref:proteasome activator complex subunit 4-like n=1 Tax=Asterias amurensis TaxID=7602 RepID=UPI003AB43F13